MGQVLEGKSQDGTDGNIVFTGGEVGASQRDPPYVPHAVQDGKSGNRRRSHRRSHDRIAGGGVFLVGKPSGRLESAGCVERGGGGYLFVGRSSVAPRRTGADFTRPSAPVPLQAMGAVVGALSDGRGAKRGPFLE